MAAFAKTMAPSILAGLLAACSTAPITVAPTAQLPPAPDTVVARPAPSRHLVDESPPCTVRLGVVNDIRPEPNDLGMMGMRAVHAADSVAWLKSALEVLKEDRRLLVDDNDKMPALVVNVDLVKAYILTMNTQKSANVVLRASYTRGGKDFGSDIARGRDTGANWANGEEEAQGALNRALVAAVWELDYEMVVRCRATAPPP